MHLHVHLSLCFLFLFVCVCVDPKDKLVQASAEGNIGEVRRLLTVDVNINYLNQVQMIQYNEKIVA